MKESSSCVLSSQRYVQDHHQEAQDGKNNGPGGESKSIRQDRLSQEDGGGSKDSGYWLYHSRELPVPEALQSRNPFAPQRHGDGEALREVLNSDSKGQGYRAAQRY